jgi:hypothetical protein
MKRIKKIIIILFFVILLLPFTVVHAEDCAKVQNSVNKLEELENTYDQMNCREAAESLTLSECNTILVEKSRVLSKLFKYNDEKTCSSIDLSSIIDRYSDDCSNEFSSEIKEISDTVMNIFFISAPFMILIFGSLDFFKIIVGSNPEQIKKNRSNFFKRLAAFLLLYLTPVIVRGIFSITPYDLNGNTYICAQEIDLTPKISSGAVRGKYGKRNYSSGNGQAIADSARDIKEFIVDNGFSYGFPGLNVTTVANENNYSKKFCCATLVGVSLYNAGIYDEDTANSIQSDSAPTTVNNLLDKDWIVIWDPDELEPGDILVYQKTECDSCGSAMIEGTYYWTSHVDIYYGDGQKITTGDGSSNNPPGFSNCSVISDFCPTCVSSSTQRWLCGLRYPGN